MRGKELGLHTSAEQPPGHAARLPAGVRVCQMAAGQSLAPGSVEVEKQTGSYRQTAELFRLLAHPARLRILDALRRRDEACVCRLQSVLKQRQPYVSQQLRALRDAGVVDSRRDGLYIYYRLSDPHVLQALDAVLGPAGRPRHHADCTCPECQGFQGPTYPCDKEGEAT